MQPEPLNKPEPLNNGLQSVLEVFDTFKEGSASQGGIGRQQIVECVVNSSRQVYQGIGSLQEDDKPGAISRLLSFVMGKGGSANK